MSLDTQQVIPWHAAQWQQAQQMLSQQRLPHALLLEGREGLGKQLFATQLAQLLLCQSTDPEVSICQTCTSCQWFKNDSHPDYLILQPEEGKKLISVDAIRATIKKVVQTSHQSGYRVLLVTPADAMTIEAANSLLKTLEEPPPQTLLMLLTDKPDRLLATIRSRATRVKFEQPQAEQALNWLQQFGLSQSASLQALALSHGAPMRFSHDVVALESILSEAQSWWQTWQGLQSRAVTPMQAAKQWKEAEPKLFLQWLEALISALIKQAALKRGDTLTLSLYPDLDAYRDSTSLDSLFALRDRVLTMLQKLQSSLNWRLQLESIAIECQTLSR